VSTLRLTAPWLVALALLGTSLSPCPRPEARWLEAAVATEAGEAGHADCHRSTPERFLDAPCPCGCGDHEPASPAGPLGEALPAAVARIEGPREAGEPAHPAPRAPAAPTAGIDHVPRIA
jgi:hypothetical protein